MAAGHSDTFHHVRDFPYFELPRSLGFGYPIKDAHGHEIAFGVKLPEIPFLPSPSKMLHWWSGELPASEIWGLQLTKFMVLQVVAGLLTLLIFWALARRLRSGEPARGKWWNFWETLAVFIRDEVVRPTIGDSHHEHHDANHARPADFVGGGDDIYTAHAGPDYLHKDLGHAAPAHHGGHVTAISGHPADKYLPFVWSCFFYVLFCNLLGAIPWMGSATGEINVTSALAVVVFGAVVLAGSRETGIVGFWKNLAPSMDLPGPIKLLVVPMIWLIELVGLLIKHGVLAVRLFANMMAGHTVIAVILGFIAVAAATGVDWLFYMVLPASILGQVAIGLLELFVAFLQAYIFAFLTALFIGTAVHPH